MNSVVRHIAVGKQVSATNFRGAMRQLTAGVSVITIGRGRDISGMTVTSVSSLSVDPAALIVSINRGASSWQLMKRYGFFGVSILTADQVDVAERFTGKDGLKGAERFTGAEWTTGSSGVPLLVGALAAIDCKVEEIVERHSHAIVIGSVLDLQVSTRTAALAYWQGQYVAIDRDEDAIRLAEVSVPASRSSRRSSQLYSEWRDFSYLSKSVIKCDPDDNG
jgi:flavin reductase (DIM6/NTAB) family NADH-FMN oxidoreductase RutF